MGVAITAVVLGTILFRLLIAIALRWGLNPNDLKLVTAVFVFIALIAPGTVHSLMGRFKGGRCHAAD
jgi:putative ABC transport system permease protein